MASVRLATADDLPAILAISNYYALTTPANFAVEPESIDLWRQSWRETHEQYPWLVAVRDDDVPAGDDVFGEDHVEAPDVERNVIGFAKASPWKGRCAYHWSVEVTVYIHPMYHGAGVGRALYERLVALLKAQGFHSALGGITQPNEPSVRLHESLGFTHVATFKRIGWKFGRWHDVGYWQLALSDEGAEPHAHCSVREAWTMPGDDASA